jgi:hypothetical protein
VSCWGDQAATPGFHELRAALPRVLVQPKGLLATEAVVTIPLGDAHPVAITSHFFEFLDDAGEPRMVHELEIGQRYEVVVSNGAGLWRYRLGDIVEVTGYVHATPSLRFVGRAGVVSDLRGEKLTDAMIAEALREVWAVTTPPPRALIRARDDLAGAGYELCMERAPREMLDRCVDRVEAALLRNPQYAVARRLGQLAPLRACIVPSSMFEPTASGPGARLGDVKPVISRASS